MAHWPEEDKVWVSDPDQAPWEIYTVLADADRFSPASKEGDEDPGCCGSTAEDQPVAVTAAGCC